MSAECRQPDAGDKTHANQPVTGGRGYPPRPRHEKELGAPPPPQLKMPASLASLICMPSGAWPSNCIALSTCIETPVAPIGWPLAFNPPEGLIGNLPSFAVQPSLMARAPCPFGVRPIASYSINSAM